MIVALVGGFRNERLRARRLVWSLPNWLGYNRCDHPQALDQSGEYLLPTRTSPDSATSDVSRPKKDVSRVEAADGWFGLTILALTALAFAYVPVTMSGPGGIPVDGFYRQFVIRLYVILLGGMLGVLFLTPALTSTVRILRRHWRDGYTYGALLGVCVFLSVFLIRMGRWQFGGYDFNIMIETGWREIQGQRPYVDFATTTPPGFNLGIKYAYQLFGINWNATLYFSAMFASLTFLWMYWLLVRQSVGRLAAMGVARN